MRERERKKGGFPGFPTVEARRSEVGPRNESYAWVPKSLCFIKLQEVGVLSYFDYSLSKDHSMVIRYSPNCGASFTIV